MSIPLDAAMRIAAYVVQGRMSKDDARLAIAAIDDGIGNGPPLSPEEEARQRMMLKARYDAEVARRARERRAFGIEEHDDRPPG